MSPALLKTLRAVRTKAPRARHTVRSYPWIHPETGGCVDKMPVSEGHDACQPIGMHCVEPVLQGTTR